MVTARTAVLFFIVFGAPAGAAADPAARCQAAKLKAAGIEASRLLKCHAKAAQAGGTVDGACTAAATGKLGPSFAKAEAKGGCTTSADAASIDGEVGAFVGDVAADLRPATTPSGCAAAKLRAAGKKALALLKAHASDKRGPDPARLAANVGKAETGFTAAFAKADAGTGCLTSGDTDGVEMTVDGGIARVVAKLCPMCGDGVAAPGEECDGADATACLGGCQADCTCAPVCGDGHQDPGEQCDGADSATCQGLCQADCTCPPPVCGNDVLEVGEQCDGVNRGPACNPFEGFTECFPPGHPMECRCCKGPGEVCSANGIPDVFPCCSGSCALTGPGTYRCSCLPSGYPCIAGEPCCNGSCRPDDTCP